MVKSGWLEKLITVKIFEKSAWWGCLIMEHAILHQSIKIMRWIRKYYTKVLSHMFSWAFDRGFLREMCLLRKWDCSVIRCVNVINIPTCEYPAAIWLLTRWLRPTLLRVYMTGCYLGTKNEADDFLVYGASIGSIWRMKLAKKMGANDYVRAFRACEKNTKSARLIMKWWMTRTDERIEKLETRKSAAACSWQ